MPPEQDNSTTARHAERVQPNVVTSETIAAMYSGAPPKAEPPKEEPEGDAPGAQPGADGDKGEKRAKKPISERMSELANKRREAETRAQQAEREAAELRAKLDAMSARAEPVKEEPRPDRTKFANDEEYIEAVAEWKADQRLAKRERDQAEAQAKAEREQLVNRWKAAQERAKAEIEDYETVIKASDVQLPGHLHQAILESDIGPHLAYYFAKHPDEAKRFAGMSATTALRQLGKLEDRLAEDADDEPPRKAASSPAVETSKAPAPVTPVKDGRAVDPGPAGSFDEYRARRRAEKKG
jgi:small-conductance mechanosensitive channel